MHLCSEITCKMNISNADNLTLVPWPYSSIIDERIFLVQISNNMQSEYVRENAYHVQIYVHTSQCNHNSGSQNDGWHEYVLFSLFLLSKLIKFKKYLTKNCKIYVIYGKLTLLWPTIIWPIYFLVIGNYKTDHVFVFLTLSERMSTS